MSAITQIEWTWMPGYVPRTWGPTIGCTKITKGCTNCYFFELHDRRHKAWKEGRWPDAPKQYHQPASVMQIMRDRFDEPYSWRKPSCVFVNSQSDLFHDDIPSAILAELFYVMADTPQHRYLILTKRPQRMMRWKEIAFMDYLPPNIWLGVTTEDQKTADERIPLLLQTPAAIRFLSVEPMLGLVDLEKHLKRYMDPDKPWNKQPACGIDWVICGGESGPRKRLFDPAWARHLRDQCASAERGPVPFYMKQIDKTRDIPADLMIRQFPA
jgi:protein gp37